MNEYEAPQIVTLGTVADFTRGVGNDPWWDSEHPATIEGFLNAFFGKNSQFPSRGSSG